MVSPLIVAVAIGLGIGFVLYVISSSAEEERSYAHEGYSSAHRSSEYSSSRRPSSSPSSSGFSDWQEECPICLAVMAIPDMIQLPCLHLFHKDCILKWRKEGHPSVHKSCPNCRSSFKNSDFGMPE